MRETVGTGRVARSHGGDLRVFDELPLFVYVRDCDATLNEHLGEQL